MKKQRSKSDQYTNVWRSRGFILFLFFILVFMCVSVTKELIRRLETNYEIEKLEAEVARLQQRNSEIHDLIALLNTSTAQNEQARVKLGMQAPGEQVVIFPDQNTEQEIVLPNSDKIRYIPLTDYETNPEKWLHFFIYKFTKTQET